MASEVWLWVCLDKHWCLASRIVYSGWVSTWPLTCCACKEQSTRFQLELVQVASYFHSSQGWGCFSKAMPESHTLLVYRAHGRSPRAPCPPTARHMVKAARTARGGRQG